MAGQNVVITLPEPEPVELVPEPMDLAVLYEDSDLIVVDKPAGLVVHPGAGHFSGTLVHGLLAHCQDLSGIGGEVRPGIVHRLDRDTSGCIVVAKNDKAHEGIATQFAERRVQKHYEAFVIGEPNPARGVIDTMFGRHPTDRKRFSSKVKRGKRALTSYAVVKSGGGLARVVIELGTGRTHQIRVHLADRGYPVVGDVMYGGQRWGSIRDKQLRELAKGLKRHALHAARLEFAHPVTGAPLQLESPLPPELSALAQVLDDLSGE
jgi:23S rRNA pseudouridine1911/1915/1917 synthase